MRTVLAVDGGNSKTDVALVSGDGDLLAAARGGTTSHQAIGLEAGMVRLTELVRGAVAMAGLRHRPRLGAYTLAGVDTPPDVRALSAAIRAAGLTGTTMIRNDTEAALRAGTDRGWGVAVVCGAGVNALGRAPDGRTARLAALGPISGDWGGGTDVGWAGLAAAVRAQDGRGAPTRLADDVPRHFGLRRPQAVTTAMYAGRIGERRVGELAPVVFAAAASGDVVARSIVDRLADEVVAMAGAMIGQLDMHAAAPDVVLAGGVFRTRDAAFADRIATRLAGIAPGARLIRLTVPPVAGSALLGLDRLSVGGVTDDHVAARVRAGIATWDAKVRPERGALRARS
jgi:N-acetylglucosamine kinase-like BadF-type ATPase